MYNREDILAGFHKVWTEVDECIRSLDAAEFTAKPGDDKWSIAEEFDHILRSNAALCSALKRKPYIYRWKFGKPNRPLRSYEDSLARYREKLERVKGVNAPTKFRSEESKVFNREDMLNHWALTLTKFERRLMRWKERQLDRTLLPHPLLGKMYVREFLYFTHFHSRHHLDSMLKKRSELRAD